MMLVPTRVASSGIHGNGLFAVEPVPKGTPIWRFVAGFDRQFTPAEWMALPEPARSDLRHFSFVCAADFSLIRSGDNACFMNHSPSPNTGCPPDATVPITTVALCDIGVGEELTCDYRAFDADIAWKFGRVARNAPLGAA